MGDRQPMALPFPCIPKFGLGILQQMFPGPRGAPLTAHQQSQLGRVEGAQSSRREHASEAPSERVHLSTDAAVHHPEGAALGVRASIVCANLEQGKLNIIRPFHFESVFFNLSCQITKKKLPELCHTKYKEKYIHF